MYKWDALLLSILLGSAMAQAGGADVPLGNPVRGKVIYAQCMGCHSPDRHRTGPKHCGLIGRKAGTAAGYEYSKAMQTVGVIWSAKMLDQFLDAPLDFVPGTSMGIAGIKNDDDRRDLIAYLVAINEQAECN